MSPPSALLCEIFLQTKYNMLTLNLVSRELKKEIKLKRIYSLTKKLYYLLTILIIITAISLMAAKIILQNEFNKVVSETTLVTKNSQSYAPKVREINTKINNAFQVQSDYINWSYLLTEITKIIPSDITLSYIKVEKNPPIIQIRGVADSRDGLLQFKEALEKSSYFTAISFPIKNILEKENIDFIIEGELVINNFPA